jgi:hypothetical protein
MKATHQNRILLVLRFVVAASFFLATGIWVRSSTRFLLVAVGLLIAFHVGVGDANAVEVVGAFWRSIC